ncbi:type II secretion system protein [Candidatus Babeliales bacterium]|nr:type II secretion system protein [Candidatus Babeliales bacterium]
MHAFMQNKTSGISFIEILVLLLMISIFMSFAVPRFITNKPRKAQKELFTEFATLVTETMQQAVITKTVHQVVWSFNEHKIFVKKHVKNSDEKNPGKQFEPVPTSLFTSTIQVPERMNVRNFIVQGKDEFASGSLQDAWFYIMPDGNSQPVTINIIDELEDKAPQFSITVNPFYSQATFHDTFQK